ncbi:MAG: alpha/beta hydrolase [Lachnospiraceae bacterium]|nr:alpha/beta hydrolase [Lachnospiraceae bacterium]
MRMHAKNGAVRLGDALMHYVSFGSGSRPMVLLPGLSDGLMTVKGKALLLGGPYRLFFEKYTVYMFSRKDPLPADCTIQDMADDQAEAMARLGIGKACIAGVSEGGMIAQALAVRHPACVEKLVIAVSAPSVNETIRPNLEAWTGFAMAGDHKGLMIDTAEKSYSARYLEKYRKAYPFLGWVGRPKDYNRFLANVRAILRFDLRDALGRISCPTLVIGGEEDRIVGVQASREMQERIPGCRLYIYPGLGHAAYEEAEDFNRRIFRFFEGEPDEGPQS